MSIVIGLGYGDEGKGLTTSYLCSQTKNPLVVRFNGGHQAGHTVVYKGKRHVFSSFGSGTLQGVPTYWSAFCTFNPIAFIAERRLLDDPTVFVNPLCPVTTPYDVAHNQWREKKFRHGSVGVGFGSTVERHESHRKLYVQDLFYPTVLDYKLQMIEEYYGQFVDFDITLKDLQYFLNCVDAVKPLIQLADDSILMDTYTPIFEGAQGILLDQDFGFFPNVTRSNTTSKNAIKLLNSSRCWSEIYYVTRSYLTRHGNGFMPGEDIWNPMSLKNNENETNVSHEYQGNFRKAPLNLDLLNYALKCDNHFSQGHIKNLVITCMDQYENLNVNSLLEKLEVKFDKVYTSNGPSLTNMFLYK